MSGSLVALLTSVGPWAVPILALIILAETALPIGFVLPGDSLLFAAGVLLKTGVIATPVVLAVVLLMIAALAGGELGYLIGRRFGRAVFSRAGSGLLSANTVHRAEAFFARHGPKAVAFARFVPFARTLIPIMAGVGSMPRRQFAILNALGAAAWVSVMISAGVLFGGVPLVAAHIDVISCALVAMALTPATVALLRSRRDQRQTGPDLPPADSRQPVPVGQHR